MASNTFDGIWSVKIVYLPSSVTVQELANTFNVPFSRIRIPKVQQYNTYYAFINDFNSEQVARNFADQWSGSSVLGNIIKCSAVPRKDNDSLPYTPRFIVRTQPELSEEPIISEEKTYYEECKQYYQLTKMPLVSVSDDILSNNLALESVSFKFVIDENYNEFNIENFLSKMCNILNISRNDIDIRKIQKGSVILELEFMKKFGSGMKKIKMKAIYHAITDKLREEMGKQNQNSGHTYWTGALQDGRDRGDSPYYCPVGRKRYSFHVCDNFHEKVKGWCICYHGTKFSFGLSILLSGLKPATAISHGKGIYASPSIIYISHPRYSEAREINLSEQNSFFKRGKYVQFALECRVHPKNRKVVGRETLGAGNTIIDPNINNNIIEWVIDNNNKDIVDFHDPDASIICSGLMMRVTDNHPKFLPE
ncbi:unnamed protein product [Adineta steineri]|uniref:Uncharacterized protein n=2 Tax=Adineta steineri TaxID=433720 RepID=A0A814H158_9BILA|nr:unnamed protein product [Adineta steineri]